MSKSKLALFLLSLLVAIFTVWNVVDFCSSDTRSTAAYLSVAFNFIAIVELIKLIHTEVKKHARK